METKQREKQRKSYITMRMIYDITMALLILAMGIVMLFGDKLGLGFIAQLDPIMRYAFGGLCILYGGFRLYRGIKHEY